MLENPEGALWHPSSLLGLAAAPAWRILLTSSWCLIIVSPHFYKVQPIQVEFNTMKWLITQKINVLSVIGADPGSKSDKTAVFHSDPNISAASFTNTNHPGDAAVGGRDWRHCLMLLIKHQEQHSPVFSAWRMIDVQPRIWNFTLI